MQVTKTGVWISIGMLVVALLGIVPAYLVFFDKPDLVYEMQVVNIPLPKDLPGQLPDALVILTVQNIGRRPSTDLQGSLAVGGDLIKYEVQGPNPAYGQVSHSQHATQVLFSCTRLAPGEYPIRVSAWYRGAGSALDVGVSDSQAAARKVASIAAESTKFKSRAGTILSFLAGLVVPILIGSGIFRTKRVRSEVSRTLLDTVQEIEKKSAELSIDRDKKD